MKEIFFTLDEPLPLLNVMLNWHWSRRRKEMKALAWEIRSKVRLPSEPFQRWEIFIKRYSVGVPDEEGANASSKFLIDCLVVCTKTNPFGLGVVFGDDPSSLMKREVIPVRVTKRGFQRTEVTIRSVEP